MIELIVFDIDGVITDGCVTVDSEGNEQKQISLKDIDAVFELHRRGYKLAAITGEDTKIVDYFEKRFPWDYFYRGNKKKKATLQQLEQRTSIDRKNICYVGDGKYDIDSLIYAGVGVCPADAIPEAKNVADIILHNAGGQGCIWELISVLEKYDSKGATCNCLICRLKEQIHLLKILSSDPETLDTMMEIGDRLAEILKNEGTLYLCGTDRCEADVQDIVTNFRRRLYKSDRYFCIECLSFYSRIPETAKNDNRTESCFSRQLKEKAHNGDMLIGILDDSINANVSDAIQYAKNNGIISVMLESGKKNMKHDHRADYVIKIPSDCSSEESEMYFFIGRTIAKYVEHKIFGGK